MKKRTWLLTIVVLAIIAIWLFHKPAFQTHQEQEPTANTPTMTNPAVQPPVSATPSNSATEPIVSGYKPSVINKGEAMQAAMLEKNNKSLDIYGRVIDQYGQPVAGAKVEGSILLNVSMVSSGGETHHTETDSDGRFQILGVHGVHMGTQPQKQGYLFDSKLSPQRPDNYQPDPNNPVIFTMWKLRGAEPLVSYSVDSKIAYDGTSTAFDILTGQTSPNGDLRVTLSRSPREVRRSGQKFDWNIRIEMLHGGLLPEDEPYPYWAPEGDYKQLFEFAMSSNNVPWQSRLTQSFFVKTAQGRYGRMQIDLHAALTPARIEIDLSMNPSGSQNLESSASK